MSVDNSGEELTSESLKAQWEELQKEKRLFLEEREQSGIECKLFCGNLHEDTTEDELRTLFQDYGTIKDVMILRDPDGTSKRSGFVKFYYKKDGNAAIDALDGKYRDKSQEKPIAVSVAISKNAHASQHGAPNMHKPSMPAAPGMPPYGGAQMGMSMGYQYPSSVPQMQMQHMGQQPNYYPPGMMYQPGSVSMPGMMPSYGGMPMPGPGTSAKGPPGANLYINNIRQGTTDAQLRNTFSMFGTVVSAHIMSQGNFGFVSFDNAHSAEAAISGMHMNHNCPFATPGKALEVSLKKEKRG